MSNTSVKLKTIADLQKESAKFYIDAYQRGYRWTKNEVRDLLDDIREFSHAKRQNDDTFYCLQPVIVTRAEDGAAWKVIDGQQRLTTIYLIYSYYLVTKRKHRQGKLPFELSYNNKPELQECLKAFTENGYDSSKVVEAEMSEYEDNIDCHFVLEAYKCICDYFSKLDMDLNTESEPDDMKKIFNTFMKIIWYEIKDSDLATEIAVFSKINMGKIALTNAELIKALLLKKEGNDSNILATQTNIAVKWDEIETQLSEDGFWSFLVNEKMEETSYATRIDFVFHVMARELNDGILREANGKYKNEEAYTVSEIVNKDKFSFYVFSNYVRLLQKHPEENPDKAQNYPDKNKNYIESIWDGVCEYYRMFKDWYKNIRWYHMIGFLVDTSKQPYIDQILQLSKLYREGSGDGNSGKGHKKYFEKKLRDRITKEAFGDEMRDASGCRDFISDLNYHEKPNVIRKILLLYNVAYLEACEENGRFPFEKYKKYKGENVSWDLEHINAVSDTMPDDDRRDSDDNNRLQWLKKAAGIPEIDDIVTSGGQKVKLMVQTIIDNKSYLSKNQPNTKDFRMVYEAVINYYGGTGEPDHSIGNLTLLDDGTNSSYRNDVFPLKRKTILERTMSDVYIPLCTRKVFMKGFAESDDLLRWQNVDKQAYTKEIISCICKYLELEDESDG